jgi:hypothetical protein
VHTKLKSSLNNELNATERGKRILKEIPYLIKANLKSTLFWDITPCSPQTAWQYISQKKVLLITTIVRAPNPTRVKLLLCLIS